MQVAYAIICMQHSQNGKRRAGKGLLYKYITIGSLDRGGKRNIEAKGHCQSENKLDTERRTANCPIHTVLPELSPCAGLTNGPSCNPRP